METADNYCQVNTADEKPEERENPLLNLLVMEKIFKNLDTLDLVRCSGVNKLWFREARKLLKSRRVYARPCFSYPCSDLKRIDKVLKKINPDDILYNGLCIQFNPLHWKYSAGCQQRWDKEVRGNVAKNIPYTRIMKNLRLKYLKINWCVVGRLEECPAALMLPELLANQGGTLEEIEIENGRYRSDWLFDERDLRNRRLWMPKLRILKGKPLEYRAFEADAILPLIRNAPVLEDLLVCVSSKEIRMGLIPKDRYNIIRSLCIERRRIQDLAAYHKLASAKPKLRCLVLQDYNYDPHSVLYEDDSSDDSDDDDYDQEDVNEVCWEIFQKFLQSSRESLEMFRIPMYDLASQVNLGWHIFPSVTLLALEIPLDAITEESYIHELLFQYDFSAKFPNLKSVKFENPRRKIRIFQPWFEDDEEGVQESQLSLHAANPCATVRSLTLKHHITNFSLEYGSALFPHVTQLDVVSTKENRPVPYGKIWAEFPNLEVLSVREGFWGPSNVHSVNYDADFLGIFEDEAKEFRDKDPNDVKNMHIVPVKPSALTIKNLCKVTVSFMENEVYGRVEGAHFFLSEAACGLLTHQMPHLKLKLVCYFCNEGVTRLAKLVEVDYL